MFLIYVVVSRLELQKQLNDLKGELLSLRVQKITGGNSAKLTKM
jgi:large subunit ribosomal protein L35e